MCPPPATLAKTYNVFFIKGYTGGLNYKEISGKFDQHLRQISKDLAANFGAVSGKPDLPKKIEENKNKEIKKEETLQATSFSHSRGPEQVSDEEWERMLAEQWNEEEEI